MLRPDTQDCYGTAVNQFTNWRNVLPAEVTPHMVLEWHSYLLNVRGIKPVTCNHYMRHMRHYITLRLNRAFWSSLSIRFIKHRFGNPASKKTLSREQILASRKILNHFIEQENT
ncbi:phage integrase N-terminal SAM-like domain-containing protein [Pantoea agglomerans]